MNTKQKQQVHNKVEHGQQRQSQITGLDAYKIALDTRNFEIGLFWQRSNYFFVLNAALAVGFFRLTNDMYALLLAILGTFASFLWYRVNLGSKYWQSRWEHRLSEKEKEIADGLNFFSASPKLINEDVIDSFSHNAEKKGWFQKYLECQALKKPSVSYNMTLLSLVFLVAWVLLLMIRVYSVKI